MRKLRLAVFPETSAAISWIIGKVMNSTGTAAIVPITKRLRR
jgi:hypothetical protein